MSKERTGGEKKMMYLLVLSIVFQSRTDMGPGSGDSGTRTDFIYHGIGEQ